MGFPKPPRQPPEVFPHALMPSRKRWNCATWFDIGDFVFVARANLLNCLLWTCTVGSVGLETSSNPIRHDVNVMLYCVRGLLFLATVAEDTKTYTNRANPDILECLLCDRIIFRSIAIKLHINNPIFSLTFNHCVFPITSSS